MRGWQVKGRTARLEEMCFYRVHKGTLFWNNRVHCTAAEVAGHNVNGQSQALCSSAQEFAMLLLTAGLGSDMHQQHVESVKQGLQELGHTGDNTISGDAHPPEGQPDRIKYT